MSAYIVFMREKLRDPEEFKNYASCAGATMAGHSAKMRAVNGTFESLEGAPIEGAVIIEFPTMEAAKDWYESPAYREARLLRFKSADYRVFITAGV
jgi:uncharacterized protein (DUF1330 family)